MGDVVSSKDDIHIDMFTTKIDMNQIFIRHASLRNLHPLYTNLIIRDTLYSS